MAIQRALSREDKNLDTFTIATTRNRRNLDIDLGFSPKPTTGDVYKKQEAAAVKQSVRNLVLTGFYERPFQPRKGSRLREMLFEPFDVFLAEDIREEISNVVKRFEPRVVLNSVRVKEGEETNTIEVELDYTIVGETLIQTVDFLLERT